MTDQPQPADQPAEQPSTTPQPPAAPPIPPIPPSQGAPGQQPPPGYVPPPGQVPPPGAYNAPQGSMPPQGSVPPQGSGPAPGYQPGVVTPMSQQDEKMWATLTHLSPLVASFVGLPFLGPLVIYLILKDRGPFIRHHAAQALNFQIIVFMALIVSFILAFVLVGFILLPLVGIGALVFSILAAVAANRGEWYRYPLTPDWVK